MIFCIWVTWETVAALKKSYSHSVWAFSWSKKVLSCKLQAWLQYQQKLLTIVIIVRFYQAARQVLTHSQSIISSLSANDFCRSSGNKRVQNKPAESHLTNTRHNKPGQRWAERDRDKWRIHTEAARANHTHFAPCSTVMWRPLWE